MIPFLHIPSNLRIPLFRADVDPSKANTQDQNLVSLVIGQLIDQGTGAGSLAVAADAVGAVASGTTITFEPAALNNVQLGMTVIDRTTTAAIPPGSTVIAKTATTATLSQSVTGILDEDVIVLVDLSPRLVRSQTDANALFGTGSMLARMYQRYRQNDPFGTVWFQPLADDPASVVASGVILFSGTPNGTFVLSLYIGGIPIPVIVTNAMSATQIGDAVAAATNGNKNLAVTAVNTAGSVAFTAKNKGASGNDIDLRINYLGSPNSEATPPGLSVVITPMASGATNPSTGLTTALATLTQRSYDYIANPLNDTASMNAIRDWMNDVSGQWSYLKMAYGGMFTAIRGTLGALQTYGAGRNTQHESVIGYYDSPTPGSEWAAAYAGAAASSLRINPAVPLQFVPIQGVLAPPQPSRFADTDRNTLLYGGISTFLVRADGSVMIENAITTYQTDPQGNPDDSYLEVESMFTLAYCLRYMKSRFESDFPRSILVDDGTRVGPGTPIVTPGTARAHFLTYYSELSDRALVQNAAAFAAGLLVQRNPTNPNRLDVLWDGVLSNQLRVLALLAQFRLRADSTASALAA